MQRRRLLRLSRLWKMLWRSVTMAVCLALVTLLLWQSLRNQHQAQLRRRIDFATVSIGREIRSQTDNRAHALERMAQRWVTQGGLSQANWSADAESLLEDYPGYRVIARVDPNYRMRWEVANSGIPQGPLTAAPLPQGMLDVIRTRGTVSIISTVRLAGGDQGVLIYAPIFLADQSFGGFMVGAVGVQPLLDSILNERVAPDYAIALRAEGTEIYRRTPDGPTIHQWSQRTKIELHGLIWELEVWPTPALLAQEQSLLPPVVLISGLLLAGLSAWVVGLSQTSQSRQRRLLAETNERQRAEQDLERFFNLSVDLLCIAGTDGYFKRVNPAFETTLGYSKDVLLSQSFISFVHPDDRAATLAEIDSLAAGKPTLSFENRYRCQDGTYRWLHWATFPIVETGLLCAVARDTTDRRATEENVRRFSTHLKHLHRLNTTHYESFNALFADCLDIGCQILGLETGIISQIVDQTYTIRSLRTNLALVVGQEFPLANTYCAAVVKAHQTVTYSQVGTMATLQGHPAYQTLHIESYLGTPIWVNETIYGTLNFSSTQVRLRDFSRHEQEIVALMAQSIGRILSADLAHQQRQTAEAALRESEVRFRTVANSAPVLLWMTGTDKRCTFFNQTWLTFTGRSFEQELGDGWTEGIHPNDYARCLRLYTTAFDAHRTFETEYRMRRADGHYRWLWSRGVPRFRSDGSFAGYIGTCIDISDRREVEKLKDEFISVVNHELRTPLPSILGYSEMLLEEDHELPALEDIDGIFDFLTQFQRALRDEYCVQWKEDSHDDFESMRMELLIASPGGLFGAYPQRSVQEFKKFYAFGSGAEYAVGAMNAAWDTAKTAEDLARIGVETAAKFDVGTGLPLTLRRDISVALFRGVFDLGLDHGPLVGFGLNVGFAFLGRHRPHRFGQGFIFDFRQGLVVGRVGVHEITAPVAVDGRTLGRNALCRVGRRDFERIGVLGRLVAAKALGVFAVPEVRRVQLGVEFDDDLVVRRRDVHDHPVLIDVEILALGDLGEQCIHANSLTFGGDDFGQGPCNGAWHLDRDLVGLQLAEHFIDGNSIAGLFEPRGNGGLGHGLAEGRNADFGAHYFFPSMVRASFTSAVCSALCLLARPVAGEAAAARPA